MYFFAKRDTQSNCVESYRSVADWDWAKLAKDFDCFKETTMCAR